MNSPRTPRRPAKTQSGRTPRTKGAHPPSGRSGSGPPQTDYGHRPPGAIGSTRSTPPGSRPSGPRPDAAGDEAASAPAPGTSRRRLSPPGRAGAGPRPRKPAPRRTPAPRGASPSPQAVGRKTGSRPGEPAGKRSREEDFAQGTRIQKVLSEAGVASRRAAEEMIRQGRVTVNGRVASLGQRIDPATDRLEVDAQRVQLDPGKVYLMLNKPEGVVTTSKDPDGRTTVIDLLGVQDRVFPVGRLDIATEGLLLLTNDGELTHRLTHPSFEVTKTYVAEVAGMMGRGVIRKLTQTGVDLGEPEPFIADAVRVLGSRKGPGGNRSVVELEVHEGSKHLVRRLLEAVDRPVLRLVRTGMGSLKLGRLASGNYRTLTRAEVDALYREVGL